MIENHIFEGQQLNFLPVCGHVNARPNDPVFCSVGIIQISPTCFFLPYVPNHINYLVSATRVDVISFPFTGCIMASYELNGLFFYCHVSTPSCNLHWAQYKFNQAINPIEFKPSDVLLTTPVGNTSYGLITSNNEKYSIVVEQINQQRICRYFNQLHCANCRPGEIYCKLKIKVL